jgi:cobalt-zinc-cadmium efflux system membrane fusion protein
MTRFAAALSLALLVSACNRREQPKAATEAHHEPENGIVEMATEAQKHVGLQDATAELKQLTEYLQVTGTVQPIDSRVAHVRSLARGRLQQVSVRVGDRVTAGTTLATMDNLEATELASQLASARAELQRLKSQMAAVARQSERNRRLVDLGAVPQKEYEFSVAEQRGLEGNIQSQESTIAGLETQLQRFGITNPSPGQAVSTLIAAPLSGVVTKVDAAPGQVIDTEDQLFSIADLSRVWVQAEVYEKDLGRVQVGQDAIVRVETYPDEQFAGRVTYISDVLDPQTRTARVRCEVPNPGTRLKLDMFASVHVPTKFNRTALAVPSEALQQVEQSTVVFVRQADTRFEVRRVQTGNTVAGMVEIVSGLKQGERIVTEGAFHLKSIVAGKELGEDHH